MFPDGTQTSMCDWEKLHLRMAPCSSGKPGCSKYPRRSVTWAEIWACTRKMLCETKRTQDAAGSDWHLQRAWAQMTEHLQPPPNVCSAMLAEYHQQCSRGGCVAPITTSKLSLLQPGELPSIAISNRVSSPHRLHKWGLARTTSGFQLNSSNPEVPSALLNKQKFSYLALGRRRQNDSYQCTVAGLALMELRVFC